MNTLKEAVTIKARAKMAARALKGLLGEKTLPKELKDSVEGLLAALNKSWADLEAEATPKESGPLPGLPPNSEGANLGEGGANQGDALYARMHSSMMYSVDDLFGQGMVTVDEYSSALEAVNMALMTFRAMLAQNAPGMLARGPWEGPEGEPAGGGVAQQMESGPLPGEFVNDVIVPLMEGAVRGDGTMPVKIIQPGWGSSGYYAPSVLQRDGPKVFTKGLHMYWNHQTPTEEAQRPEGDLNDLAAVLASDARWIENGAAGAGLYADAKVMAHYVDKIESLAPHIGLSIRAMGKAQTGEAEGKTGPIITELSRGRSVDFVTLAGAGGEIVSLFEAARWRADKKNTPNKVGDVATHLQEAADMDKLQELQEANATLQTKLDEALATNARLTEALAMREAREVLVEVLSSARVPHVTKARLMEALSANPPMKDGKLDEAAFAESAGKAVTAEIKYLSEAAGLGRISGMGGGADGADEQAGPDLAESFRALGLSESAAKIAASGR